MHITATLDLSYILTRHFSNMSARVTREILYFHCILYRHYSRRSDFAVTGRIEISVDIWGYIISFLLLRTLILFKNADVHKKAYFG